jgi:hypothetical protein
MGQLFDCEGLLGHKRPTGIIPIIVTLTFHCHYEAEGVFSIVTRGEKFKFG